MLRDTKYGKILLGSGAVLLIFLIVLVTLYTKRMSGSIEGLAAQQATLLAESIAEEVQAILAGELKVLSVLAEEGFLVTGPGAQRQHLPALAARLKGVLDKTGDGYESVFVTDADGIVIADGSKGNYLGVNVSPSDFFRAAKNGSAGVGKPFQSTTGNLLSMIGVPVRDRQKRFAGCMVAVVKLDPLFKRITSVRIGGSGYSFMVDGSGIVIAHSNKGSVLQLNVRTMPGMEGIAGMIFSGQSGADIFHSNSIRKMAAYAPVKLTGWSVCVVQDAEDFIILPRSTRNLMIVAAGILLVIILLGVLSPLRRMTEPDDEARKPEESPPEGKDPIEIGLLTQMDPVKQAPAAPAEETFPKEPPPSDEGTPPAYAGQGRARTSGPAANTGHDFDRVSSFLKRPFEKQNHYEVLELSPGATPFEVRQAYKTAIQIYRTGSMVSYSFFSEEERKRILARLEEAYTTLINDESRADYDRTLVGRGELDERKLYRKSLRKPVSAADTRGYKTDKVTDLSERVKTKKESVPLIQEILDQDSLTGNDLRRIRTEMGISLSEIADITRIRIGILHAMEEDQLDQVPFGLNLESFLKAYANCLKLDADMVTHKYMKRTR